MFVAKLVTRKRLVPTEAKVENVRCLGQEVPRQAAMMLDKMEAVSVMAEVARTGLMMVDIMKRLLCLRGHLCMK
jgi:hypothetical protein